VKGTQLLSEEYGDELVGMSATLQRALNGGLSIRKNSLGEVWDRLLITGPAPTWHLVGGAGEPAFQNGWAAFGAPYQAPRFMMDLDGRVVIEGLHKKNTAIAASIMWTLPAGYRPAADRILGGVADNGAALPALPRVDITSAGNLTFQATSAGAGGAGYLSLTESFYADPANCAPPDLKLATPQILRTKLKQVLGVQVLGVMPKVTTDYVGPVTAQWQRSREGIVINSFTGLQPGRQYYVSLFVIGDDKS